MSCSDTEGDPEPGDFLPLIMISWDLSDRRPIVAFSTDPWDRLSTDEARLVFGEVCSLALESASLAIPGDLNAKDWGDEW